MDGPSRRPTDSSRSEGTPSPSEGPSGGAKTFWLLLGRLPKVTRCKSGTLSGRDRSNGYVHQTSHLTPLPPPCSPTHLVSGALHRVKRETGDLCLRMRSPVLPPQR